MLSAAPPTPTLAPLSRSQALLLEGTWRGELDEILPPKTAAQQEPAKYETPAAVNLPPVQEPFAGLDRYGEFLRRLVALVRDKPLSQKDIAKSLGLEAAQAKAWLKKAVQDGAVETEGKTKKYALPQRRLFA